MKMNVIPQMKASRLQQAWHRSDFGRLGSSVGPEYSFEDLCGDLTARIAPRACFAADQQPRGLMLNIAATATRALTDFNVFRTPTALDDEETDRLLALYALPVALRIWVDQYAETIGGLLRSLPRWLSDAKMSGSPGLRVELLDLYPHPKTALDQVQQAILNVSEPGKLCLGQLNRAVGAQLAQISERIPEKDKDGFEPKGGGLFIRKHPNENPRALAKGYFKETPLPSVLRSRVPITLSDEIRSRHTLIYGAPGSGKSWMMMRQIANILPDVIEGLANLIIFDPKCHLIDDLLSLEAFAPGTKLLDRTWLVDPSIDQLTPRICLWGAKGRAKPYDVAKYAMHYMIGEVGGKSMTSRQRSVFSHYLKAVMMMGDADLAKLSACLRDSALVEPVMGLMPEDSREFFLSDDNQELRQDVAPAIGWRLHEMRDSKRLDQMVNTSMVDADFDVAEKTAMGSVLFVRLPEAGLGLEQQSEIGRAFLAECGTDVAQRQDVEGDKKPPVSLVIDEAHLIIPGGDPYALHFMRTARSADFGVTIATQVPSNFDPRFAKALPGLTGTQIIGRVPYDVAVDLGKELKCQPDIFPVQDVNSQARHFVMRAEGLLPTGCLTVPANDDFSDIGWQEPGSRAEMMEELKTRFARPESKKPARQTAADLPMNKWTMPENLEALRRKEGDDSNPFGDFRPLK